MSRAGRFPLAGRRLGRVTSIPITRKAVQRMYRKIISGAIAALLVAGGVAFASTAANATDDTETCVPSEAWTETINHPAVGEPMLTVENPDYVPATEDQTVADGFVKWNWTGGPVEVAPTAPPGEGWHEVGPTNDSKGDAPDVVHAGNGNGSWFYYQSVTKVIPGTPAVGEPTIQVPNPAYVAPRVEVIEHAAVTCEQEPEPVVNACETGQSTHSTNLAPLWSDVDTRSAGHYEYVENGLHVWTDDATSNAKVSLGQAIAFPLHDTGIIALDWTGTTPPPGVNLFVNFGADGSGTLVYESVYGQDLWLTNGSSATVKANAPVNGGGNGSQWHGTIDQWLTKYPEAQVVGIAFSLGSGVHGDGVISSITVGCGTHTFDYQAPVVIPEEPEPVVTVDEEEVVDCEAGTVTTTTTTTTIGWVYDEESNTWIEGEPEVVVTTDEREATAEECPVVVEPTPTPTVPAPAPAPATPAKAASLAVTGADGLATVGWLTGGALALALGSLGVVLGLRRRQIAQD